MVTPLAPVSVVSNAHETKPAIAIPPGSHPNSAAIKFIIRCGALVSVRMQLVRVKSGIATKIIDLGYSVSMEGRTLRAYRLEFHDLNFTLTGGRQYWLSIGVKYTFSIVERAFFCYNADCARNCLIRWNNGKVLTATTIQAGTVNTPGWADTGNDFSFLIAADGVNSPGPIGATPACRADFNVDGVLNSQDIFDYLNSWFTGCP